MVILLLLEKIGKEKENTLLWFKVICALIALELACNFYVALYSSMIRPYFGAEFGVIIDLPEELINFLPSVYQDAFYSLKHLYAYCLGEAIVTWIVCLPCISIIFAALIS